jgi:1,2-diacylglycerol 3-alpha-glucosyltransferase
LQLHGVKTAVIFDNFGPYHLARLWASTNISELMAVEVAASSAEYAWKSRSEDGSQRTVGGEPKADSTPHPTLSPFKAERVPPAARQTPGPTFVTLLERGTSREVSSRELAARLNRVLDDFQPQVVFIPGWSGKAAFAALSWCVRRGVPAVAMSESTEWDESRRAWREAVKRKIVGLGSAALVGGTPHRDYMVQLGMPGERVFLGYDAVDNEYFSAKAEENRVQKAEIWKRHGLPEKYFLASARFVEKKNLPRLLQAYALYRKKSETLKTGSTPPPREEGKAESGKRKVEIWDLVLLGDGALRESLCALRSSLGLDACVHLPGFKQYPDLPAYYGLASAFIHASTTEQWGLVVNEAMASGLPVLVSNRCGCATDLVREGVNGFTFDPYDVEGIARLMFRISDLRSPISDFGIASQRIISDWGPLRFATGLKQAAECALRVGPAKPTRLQRMILRALLWK